MIPNRGALPCTASGKRVIVKLRNGNICGREQVALVSPIGWSAESTRWTLRDEPHDVVAFEVAK